MIVEAFTDPDEYCVGKNNLSTCSEKLIPLPFKVKF